MTDAEKLAAFVTRITNDDLDGFVLVQLKIRILDALGCAFGALDSYIVSQLRAHLREFNSGGSGTLIGGGRSALDRAAFFNSALGTGLIADGARAVLGSELKLLDQLRGIR